MSTLFSKKIKKYFLFIQLAHFVQLKEAAFPKKAAPVILLFSLFRLYGSVKNDQRHKYKICISCICKAMSFSIWCDGDITGFYRTFYTVIIVLAFTT